MIRFSMALFLAFSGICPGSIYSQNLVENGSFEDYTFCPIHQGMLRLVSPWNHNEVMGSADYYHSCANNLSVTEIQTIVNEYHYFDSLKNFPKTNTKNYGVPGNTMGEQSARSGKAYAGFFALGYDTAFKDYTPMETIYAPLKESLKQGETYYAEMYVSAADRNEQVMDAIGMYFSQTPFDYEHLKQAGQMIPQIINKKGNVLKDTKDWIKISGTFTAKGGEKYIVIGHFNNKKNTIVAFTHAKNAILNSCYYYIDDIMVMPVKGNTSLLNGYKETAFSSIDTTQRYYVFFESGKSELSASSVKELDTCLNLLQKNSNLKIHIVGYTDTEGNETENKQLSIYRAEAVYKYFVLHGIHKGRLRATGFGSVYPMMLNTTEEGRKKNRRVELKMMK